MKLSRIVSTAISLALGLSLAVPAYAAESKFTDVSANAYYANSVSWAVEKGITSGTSATTFSPDATCTTAQILTFLWRANGSIKSGIANPFSDVSESDYFYDAAIWAYEKGLVSGTQFNGNTPCTRSATVTYMWKLAGKPAAKVGGLDDVAPTAEYAQAVSWAIGRKITAGTSNTTFSPDLTCTRGQIATFIYRAENPGQQSAQKPQQVQASQQPTISQEEMSEANYKAATSEEGLIIKQEVVTPEGAVIRVVEDSEGTSVSSG